MKSKLQQLAMAAMVSAAFNSTSAAVRYVDVNNINSTPPHTGWDISGFNIVTRPRTMA